MNEEHEVNQAHEETDPLPPAQMETAHAVAEPLPEPALVALEENAAPLPEPATLVADQHEESPIPAEVAEVHEEVVPAATEVAEIGAEVPAPSEVAEVPAVPENKKKWYVVKVQSGREDSIKNNLERRVKIENLEPYIGRILIPVEKITEVRNGRRVEKKRKKFPGYLMCEVELNDDVKVLFRESSGVGEFVGGRIDKDPAPMPEREVERMLLDTDTGEGKDKKVQEKKKEDKIVLNFAVGDRVKVLQGMFKDSEGEVKEIPPNPAENSKVKVVVQFWGRPVDVDVDYWHVERV